jgi:RecB family exonuclease
MLSLAEINPLLKSFLLKAKPASNMLRKMKPIFTPFGKPAWDARREVMREIIGSFPGPPHDFRRALWLVPNDRIIRPLKLAFMDALRYETGASGCIPPEFAPANRFISNLARRGGKPVLEGLARRLAIEEICRKAAHDFPQIGHPQFAGPQLAPVVAAALDRFYTYGCSEQTLRELAGDSLPSSILLKIKKDYERWLSRHGLADASAARAALAPSTDDFTSRYSSIVLDGFYDADPAELRVLKALSEVPDCRFLLEAPGLAELTEAEGYGPYSGTKELLSALGLEVSDTSSAQDAEASLIAGAAFGGRPLRESIKLAEGFKLSGDIKITGAASPVDEVWGIAREIKELYLAGALTDLNRVLVFFPKLDQAVPVIEDAFGSLGIVHHLPQGYPLAQSPVVKAFMDLLALPQDYFSFRDMRKVFCSALIRLTPDGNNAPAFDEMAREFNITGGRRNWKKYLEPLDDAEDETLAASVRVPLARLIQLTDRFADSSRLTSEWAGECINLLEQSGISETIAASGSTNLISAHAALVGLLNKIRESSGMVEGRTGISDFLAVLRTALKDSRYRPGEDNLTGVRVLGKLEALSEEFDAIFAGGLVDGAMPEPMRQDIFFGGGAWTKLGLPDPRLASARDGRLFLGLMLSAPTVRLSWPEAAGGRPAVPSPYITALTPLIDAGLIKKTTCWCRPVDPSLAYSPDEAIRALGIIGALGGADDEFAKAVLAALPVDSPGRNSAASSLLPPPEPLPVVPPTNRTFSVTELEEYLRCRYRYYNDRIIEIQPPDEPEDDIAPHKAGSIIHKIFSDFYEHASGPVLDADKAAELVRLCKIAERRFAPMADTLTNRELKRRFVQFLAPGFIEAEAALAASRFKVCEVEKKLEVSVPDGADEFIVIKGKVDRLDADADGNFVVVDYKTGNYPGTGGINLSDSFQLPVYAKMAEQAKPEKSLLKKPAAFVYYNLKQGTMRDVVFCDSGVFDEKVKPTRAKDAEKMQNAVDGKFEEALNAARGILAGDFSSIGKKGCRRSCNYSLICGQADEDNGGEGGSDE